jgi:hypothetical protein
LLAEHGANRLSSNRRRSSGAQRRSSGHCGGDFGVSVELSRDAFPACCEAEAGARDAAAYPPPLSDDIAIARGELDFELVQLVPLHFWSAGCQITSSPAPAPGAVVATYSSAHYPLFAKRWAAGDAAEDRYWCRARVPMHPQASTYAPWRT